MRNIRDRSEKKRELLFSITKRDFEVSFFSGSGAGGQHRNRHKNCVRIFHPPSGAAAIGTEQRSMIQNRGQAFKRLIGSEKFKKWFKLEICRRSGLVSSAEDYADREIDNPGHLRVETKESGRWRE